MPRAPSLAEKSRANAYRAKGGELTNSAYTASTKTLAGKPFSFL